MLRHSLVALTCIVAAAALAGCASEAADADPTTGAASAVTSGRMVGDFHLETRTLDEAFLFGGMVSELAITTSGGADDCHFKALQAKDGCDANTSCTDGDILSSDEHRSRIEGACTVSASKLTLETPKGELAFKVEPGTAPHVGAGFVLTSIDGKQLSKAGSAAFFQRTSRDPGEALSRAYSGGANDALSKSIKTTDASLSPAVRAALKDIVDELSESDDDVESEVTDSFAVFATPFDTTPVAYAVEGTTSGDHCGGFRVVAVDANGHRISTELQDGDC